MALYDLNTAKTKVTDFATQKYGRGPQNDQEWGAVAKGINYGDGVDDTELKTAFSNTDQLAASMGAKPLQPSNTGAVPPSAPNPVQTQMQTALQGILTRGQQAPSLTDPTLAVQSDAFRAASQRSAERQRNALAERLNASGLANSGAMNTGVQGILADQGLQQAQFDAGLLGKEVDSRRQELIQGIQIAAQLGNQEAARQLQEELARLDLGFREKGLALQGELGRGSLGVDLLRTMLQNEQFNSQLGLNAAQMQAILNQQALQTLLGGF